MERKNIILPVLTAIIISVMMAACSGSRTAVTPSADYASMSLQQRFAELASRSGEWKELNLPVKVELMSPSSFSISGRAYLRRDKSVYVSLRFLGMEVGNFYMTGDSVYVCDKVNRRYVAEGINNLLSGADFTIADIQDMMLGRVFVNGEGTITPSMASKVTMASTADGWTIVPKKKIAGAEYSFTLTDSNLLKSLTAMVKGRTATCEYADRASTDAGDFMSTATVTVPNGDKSFKVRLKWSFGSARWQVDESVGWKRPSGYTRVSAAQLMKIFSAFK